MMRVLVLFWIGGLVLLAPSVVSAQQPQTCEERLLLSNTLLNEFAKDRNRVQIDAAQLTIALEKAQKEIEALKGQAPVVPKK